MLQILTANKPMIRNKGAFLESKKASEVSMRSVEMKNIGRNFLAIVLSLGILFSAVAPAYAFGPLTHGYIARETLGEVTVNDATPNPYVFTTGAIAADVGHVDTKNIHDQAASFGDKMLKLAKEDADKASYAASWVCHGASDEEWMRWLSDHEIKQGWGEESGYKFLFDAYARLYKSYAVPLSLAMDSQLIRDTYTSLYGGHFLPWKIVIDGVELDLSNLSESAALEAARALLWAIMVGETLLIDALAPFLSAGFDLSPVGAFETVNGSFDIYTDRARQESKQKIETDWESKKVGDPVVAKCKTGFWGKWCDKCETKSGMPLLGDGWIRDTAVRVYTDINPGTGFCSWGWTTGVPTNPNIKIRLWANSWKYARVDYQVSAKRKRLPQQQKAKPLQFPADLIEQIGEKRAAKAFTIVDPLLTVPKRVRMEDIEKRQAALLGEIGKVLADVGRTIYENRLTEVKEEELVINNRIKLADLVADKGNQFEGFMLNYFVLETRRQAILYGRDILQTMPKEILPFGTKREIPKGKPIAILANDFDYLLAFDLVEFLKQHGFSPIRWTATGFDKFKKEKMIVILGDLNAGQGVGEIVKSLLSPEEVKSLERKGSYLFTIKTDVFTEGQRIFIFSGENSFITREAHVRHREVVSEIPWDQVTVPIPMAPVKPQPNPDVIPFKPVPVPTKPGEPLSQLAIPEMPIVIVPLRLMPPEFSYAGLTITPAECKPGERITISVDVANVGEAKGSHRVILKINQVIESIKEVTIDGGKATSIS